MAKISNNFEKQTRGVLHLSPSWVELKSEAEANDRNEHERHTPPLISKIRNHFFNRNKLSKFKLTYQNIT